MYVRGRACPAKIKWISNKGCVMVILSVGLVDTLRDEKALWLC